MALRHKPYGRGDIIVLSNDPKPKNNNEQKGPRPWLVVSRTLLNGNGPFVWALPFTTTEREYPLAYNWTEKRTRHRNVWDFTLRPIDGIGRHSPSD